MKSTIDAMKQALDIISRTTSSAFVKTMLEEAIAREEAQTVESDEFTQEPYNLMDMRRYPRVHPTQTPVNAPWLIRKVPNTKDQYFIAEGAPPSSVLEVYRIK